MSITIEYIGTYESSSERMFDMLRRKEPKINNRRNSLTQSDIRRIWESKLERGDLWFGWDQPEIKNFFDRVEVCWYNQYPIEQEPQYLKGYYYRHQNSFESETQCEIEFIGLSYRGELVKMSGIPSNFSWFPAEISVENLQFVVNELRDLVAFHSL